MTPVRPAIERVLVVMRLADMQRVHPAMDTDHVCAQCGAVIGIFPSGQRLLQTYPDTTLLCHVCRPVTAPFTVAAGGFTEPFETVRKQ